MNQVLGIDPGIANAGYALLYEDLGEIYYRKSLRVRAGKIYTLNSRLKAHINTVEKLLGACQVSYVMVEDIFMPPDKRKGWKNTYYAIGAVLGTIKCENEFDFVSPGTWKKWLGIKGNTTDYGLIIPAIKDKIHNCPELVTEHEWAAIAMAGYAIDKILKDDKL